MQIPKRRSEQVRMSQKRQDHHLTPEAIEGLQRELVDLKERQQLRAAAEVQRTREMGDLSENAGYQTAKAQLTRINFRILEIEEELKHAIPIRRGGSSGVVEIGTTVTVRTGSTERTYEILGAAESSPGKGRISHESPLGSALMGHRVGETVTLTVHGHTTRHAIVRIE